MTSWVWIPFAFFAGTTAGAGGVYLLVRANLADVRARVATAAQLAELAACLEQRDELLRHAEYEVIRKASALPPGEL